MKKKRLFFLNIHILVLIVWAYLIVSDQQVAQYWLSENQVKKKNNIAEEATTLLFNMWQKKQNKSAKHCEWESSEVVDCSGAIYVVFMDSVYFFFALEVGHCAAPWKLFKMMQSERAANMVFRGAFWVYRQWEQGKKRKNSTREPLGGFRLLVWSLFLAKRSAGSHKIRKQVSAALMEVFQELRWILLHRVLTAAC